MMTTADLERLKAAFAVKPSFEFPSPEGQVGYPSALLELDKDQLQQKIDARHKYEAEAREGEQDDVSPIPEHPPPADVDGDDTPARTNGPDDEDHDPPVALSD